jgi:internalin A
LRTLDLEDNHLGELPIGLDKLPNLQVLCLHNNESLNIPAELLGPTWGVAINRKALLHRPSETLGYFYRAHKLKKRPLNEAKVLLVGRGGAGKTSLCKRLLFNDFDEGEDKTPGIQVSEWPLRCGQDSFKLNIWDFGGQEIMHATHQFFLTERSLYALVVDAREDQQDANIDHWLRLVTAYGGGSPALVVINKCDQHPLDLDERGLRQKFPCIRQFIRTDCKTEHGLLELRAAIERESFALPDARTPFPETWFAIKRRLEAMSDDYIAYEEYQRLCASSGEADPSNQDALIGFLRDLGSILYFREEPRLCSLGVLRPDWATQGIYQLLNSTALKSSGGVLDIAQLSQLLDDNKYPRHRHDYLIALMDKFQLCYELPNTRHSRYLLPELLPKEMPELPEWKIASCLCFEYHYNILPEGLLPRFIVRKHSLSNGAVKWRHGVELRHGESRALVQADVQERRVRIAVSGPGKQPRDLLAVIRHEFEEIHADIKGLKAEEKVPVPGYPDQLFDYRRLLVREAYKESLVEFEAPNGVVKLPLANLLDNWEEQHSRHERALIIINNNYFEGGLDMSKDINIVNSRLTGSIVGAHMQNISVAIQAIPTSKADLRAALDELRGHTEPLLQELPEDVAEEAAQNLEDFTREAAKEKPRKGYLDVTSKGLVDAASTVAQIAPSIIGVVAKLKELLGF